ncbi:restriction endonuclease [Epilithonimonas sp.]|uniref:restriction endonuclease n=1 Tax=Epilithonimonas sp. TaxID=2894511 RepID=UPI0028AFC4EF|nr:restriction endonuclease [Epilithonimonas sp.]
MNLTPREFEVLLCEFNKKDLPPNFIVEHDVKDVGNESESYRQIDTKIRGKLGISDILICGEAKNWNSPVGIETIDGLVGKYLSSEIKANKVLIFSNDGFTEPATTRAKKIGIELVEPVKLKEPIQEIPFIVAVGFIGQMYLTMTHNSVQQHFATLNLEDYTILKGDEKLTFIHNVFRLLLDRFKKFPNKDFNTELENLEVRDANVLYELKQKPHHKFNADFDIKINIHWQYHCLKIPFGLLKHINSGETKIFSLKEDEMENISEVLLSPKKEIYENKKDCFDNFIKDNNYYHFALCLIEPDSNKNDPERPQMAVL